MTTSEFTKQARQAAEKLSKRIILVDGQQLVRLMVLHDVGVRVEAVLKIKKIDEDFFS